ncbi:preprotein translocase subunit SecE [Catenovulum maritimum]|uniref:Protein translocase subunit SecE n=1 Tax=Catenovulum maritimum TaxID=1513271 RepID=A0A0J8GSI9_9ALTE|nr:preprotein translocase subunit SecE [Catenovulum maritimum]KMT63673.1 preprotein translocase subunit SecE [Catenovulum maritimum]
MSVDVEKQGAPLDIVKWVLTIGILGAAIYGNLHYTDQVSVLWRALGVVFAVAVAGLIAFQTTKGKDALSFAKESRIEVRKVIWPSRDETVRTTLIVLVATVFMALLLWLIDGGLMYVVKFITGLEI